MKRRNFLKLLSLAAPAVAIPVTVKAQEPKPKGNQQYSYTEGMLSESEARARLQQGHVRLDFDFDGEPLIMVSYEGSFRHSPRIDWCPNPHPDYRQPEPDCFDFNINLYVAWVSDADFHNKIHNSKKFDLTVIYEGRVFILKDVYWSNMSYEPGSTAFSLNGVAIDVGT